MGGFSDILGQAASGYHAASQQEAQRQFQAEMDKREQVVGLLGKLAGDETAHPETRQNAFQMALDIVHAPHNKPIKPDFNKLITTAPGRTVASAQPNSQAMQIGNVPAPVTPPRVSLESPPSPPGMHYTPEEQTQMAASRTGAVTGAQAGAQMETPAYQLAPDGSLTMVPVSHAGTQMGQGIPNVIPPLLFGGQPQGDKIPASQARQSGIPVPSSIGDDEWVDVRRNRAGMVTNVAPTVPPVGYLPQSKSSVATDAQGLQTKTGTQTSRKLPGQGGQASAKPATKPTKPDIGAPPVPAGLASQLADQGITPEAPKAAAPAMQPAVKKPAAPAASPADQPGRDVQRIFDRLGLTPKARENVSAAMDRMMNEGTKPDQKFSKVEQLAYTALQKQGITPPLQGTEATRSMADKGRQILPLIEQARRLIANNPDALGPLAGRWSQLSQKAGNLTGAPKELAGVLTSIYSLAGGLHGWRAIRVAEEFEKTYGGLSSNAQSLNDGLNAIVDTANSVIKTGYPGKAGEGMLSGGSASSVSSSGKTVLRSKLAQIAIDHHTTEEEVERQAKAQGYTVK